MYMQKMLIAAIALLFKINCVTILPSIANDNLGDVDAMHEAQAQSSNKNLSTLLHDFAKQGLGQKNLSELLTEHSLQYITATNPEGKTALHVAVEKKRLFFIKAVLTNYSDLEKLKTILLAQDADGNTPLHTAAYRGDSEVVTTILLHAKKLCSTLLLAQNINSQTPRDLAQDYPAIIEICDYFASAGQSCLLL
jgi:ankyrin repeat protein